jgi:hypothetical protein
VCDQLIESAHEHTLLQTSPSALSPWSPSPVECKQQSRWTSECSFSASDNAYNPADYALPSGLFDLPDKQSLPLSKTWNRSTVVPAKRSAPIYDSEDLPAWKRDSGRSAWGLRLNELRAEAQAVQPTGTSYEPRETSRSKEQESLVNVANTGGASNYMARLAAELAKEEHQQMEVRGSLHTVMHESQDVQRSSAYALDPVARFYS